MVVHRTDARTRLRLLAPHSKGADLAGRLRGHPRVRSARWSAATCCITVDHSPGLDVDELVDGTPESAPSEEVAASPPAPPLMRQLAVPAIAVGAGLAGIVPLSGPMIAACALPMGRRALRSVQRRRVSIDVLDTAAAVILLGSGDVLAAGVSVGLVELGERIRRRAAGEARRVLRGSLSPDSRVRLVRKGTEPRVAPAEVVPGDRAVVYPGEIVPVDGVVVTGRGAVDNQAWTGEPSPRRLVAGDRILAGATVVDGRLVIEVSAAGDDTRAGRLAVAIEDAIASTAQVSDLAQRIADRFVVPVLAAAGAVFALTGDVARLASMLIVDFGTGVRVSVPTAVLTTMVAGARQDVIFRTGRSVETLARIDAVVFDKTGTLTSGRPAVVGIDAVGSEDPTTVLRLAAAAEGHLPHPLARAVRSAARRRDLRPPEPEAVRYVPGGGVVATIEGRRVVVGDLSLLAEEGIEGDQGPGGDRSGSSRVWVAIDGRCAAALRLRDTPRPEARQAIDALREAGIREMWLATGDRENAARRVASRLGITQVRARLMPEDKIELVRSLRERGRRVAVVGDGINDAAAMAEADVGISVASGAELARQAADIIVGDLAALPVAVRLARDSMLIVRQNVGIVAACNGTALALATAGGLPPLAATLVNNGSTTVVAANALRPLRTPARARAEA